MYRIKSQLLANVPTVNNATIGRVETETTHTLLIIAPNETVIATTNHKEIAWAIVDMLNKQNEQPDQAETSDVLGA